MLVGSQIHTKDWASSNYEKEQFDETFLVGNKLKAATWKNNIKMDDRKT
jgi:hypothetical protein